MEVTSEGEEHSSTCKQKGGEGRKFRPANRRNFPELAKSISISKI